MTSQEFKAHMNYCNHGDNEGKCIFEDSECPRLLSSVDEDKFESWIEQSYWEFDAMRTKRTVSERDVYKWQMRALKNSILKGGLD